MDLNKKKLKNAAKRTKKFFVQEQLIHNQFSGRLRSKTNHKENFEKFKFLQKKVLYSVFFLIT